MAMVNIEYDDGLISEEQVSQLSRNIKMFGNAVTLNKNISVQTSAKLRSKSNPMEITITGPFRSSEEEEVLISSIKIIVKHWKPANTYTIKFTFFVELELSDVILLFQFLKTVG